MNFGSENYNFDFVILYKLISATDLSELLNNAMLLYDVATDKSSEVWLSKEFSEKFDKISKLGIELFLQLFLLYLGNREL